MADVPLFIGIDGGGSTLRVALTDAAMNVLAQTERGTANPSSIGKEASAALIQSTIAETLVTAGKSAHEVSAVALGVAGALYLGEWLHETASVVLPHSLIVPSSDFEIALVGARGERFGVLILAGTGSVAFGVNRAGESVQVGGWGYLLGDEGSGYSIGLQALKTFVRVTDGRNDTGESQSLLPQKIAEALNLSHPREIIQWTYSQPRVRDIAQLSKLVFELAEAGDRQSIAIARAAMSYLSHHINVVRVRLKDHQLPVAFAGGLLDNENYFSVRFAKHLKLTEVPKALYPPVIGAAILAKLTFEAQR
jgi:N-acetylglucosamine kinase-like BadF-type ATPase